MASSERRFFGGGASSELCAAKKAATAALRSPSGPACLRKASSAALLTPPGPVGSATTLELPLQTRGHRNRPVASLARSSATAPDFRDRNRLNHVTPTGWSLSGGCPRGGGVAKPHSTGSTHWDDAPLFSDANA